MMKDSINTYDLYSPLPEHTIIEFISGTSDSHCHRVVLKQLNTGEITTVEVSFCAILIGFRPDLQFLDPTKKDDIKAIEQHDVCNEFSYNTIKDNNQLLTSPYALFSRKIEWLKNLCAKCKHLSICERSRKYCVVQRQPINHRSIVCSCTDLSQNKSIINKSNNDNNNNSNHSNNNNNNDNICNNNYVNSNCDTHYLIDCKENEQPFEKSPVVVTEPKALPPLGLGEDRTRPVDCKTNPIAVDKYTNRVLNVPTKGLFAMGPLVADNFIRFIPGGALAITSALWKQR